jgi:uncharacterized membrane protein YdjX (TVP38/TMEM64 family)
LKASGLIFLKPASFGSFFSGFGRPKTRSWGQPKEIAMSKQKILIICSFVLIAFFLLQMFREPLASMMRWFRDPQAVSAAIQHSGFWGPTILFVLFVLQVFLAFIPGQALMIASGYIYGFTGGLLITWISLVLGGQAAFWLARRYGRLFAEKWIAPSVLDRWDRHSAGQSIGFFAITLVLPLFPNDAMCYVAGLGKMPSWRFFLANMLGRGLASFFTVLVGAYGSMIPAPVWVGMAVLIVMVFLGWQIVKSRNSSFLMA